MIKRGRKTYLHNSKKKKKNPEKISTVYTLTKTILNHEKFIKTLDTKDILDNMNKLPCNCTISPFTDPNHEHIVTGDIRIVQN